MSTNLYPKKLKKLLSDEERDVNVDVFWGLILVHLLLINRWDLKNDTCVLANKNQAGRAMEIRISFLSQNPPSRLVLAPL